MDSNFLAFILFLFNLIAVAYWFSDAYTIHKKTHFNLLGGVKDIIEIVHLKKIRIYFIVYFLWTIGWGLSMQWYPPYSIEVYHASVVSITNWMILLGIA